jgi:hypothetical protein
MRPLKIIFLAQFFQLVIQVENLLNLGHVHTKSTFKYASELESLPFNDDTRIDQFMLEKMYALVIHNYKTSYVLIYF